MRKNLIIWGVVLVAFGVAGMAGIAGYKIGVNDTRRECIELVREEARARLHPVKDGYLEGIHFASQMAVDDIVRRIREAKLADVNVQDQETVTIVVTIKKDGRATAITSPQINLRDCKISRRTPVKVFVEETKETWNDWTLTDFNQPS